MRRKTKQEALDHEAAVLVVEVSVRNPTQEAVDAAIAFCERSPEHAKLFEAMHSSWEQVGRELKKGRKRL